MGGKNVRGRGRQGGVSCKEGLAGSKCQSERLGAEQLLWQSAAQVSCCKPHCTAIHIVY